MPSGGKQLTIRAGDGYPAGFDEYDSRIYGLTHDLADITKEQLQSNSDELDKAYAILLNADNTDTQREEAHFVINAIQQENREIRHDYGKWLIGFGIGAIALCVAIAIKK